MAQKYKSIHSTPPNSSTLLSHSFTPLQNSFTRRPRFVHFTGTFLHSRPPVSFTPLQNSCTRRPQIPSLHCKILLLHAPRFLHSTAKFFYSTPPDSFTPLQNSFTPRPQIPSLHCKIPALDAPRFLHSTAKFLHSTPPDSFTPLQNSCTRRPQIRSLHCKILLLHAPRFLHSTAKFLSSGALRRWRCMFFRWEMLVGLIGMGIIDLQTPTYTKPPESPSNDTKSLTLHIVLFMFYVQCRYGMRNTLKIGTFVRIIVFLNSI